MSDERFYKVLSKEGDALKSIMPSAMSVSYKVDKKNRGAEGTKLFIFESLRHARDFSSSISWRWAWTPRANIHIPLPAGDMAIYECECGGVEPCRSIVKYVDAMQDIDNLLTFWKIMRESKRWFHSGGVSWMIGEPPGGTLMAEWVKPVMLIDLFKYEDLVAKKYRSVT